MGKHFLYLLLAIAVLIASWETELISAASKNPRIPGQSIRIRIIANSDRMEDQWIKMRVRDAISANINQWVGDASSIEEARAAVLGHIGGIESVVRATLAKYGYDYGYKVELGNMPFPTKIFADQVYPAGKYEALRITLGRGKGQNWWCVMFPPLCFVKGTTAKPDSAKATNKPTNVLEKQTSAQATPAVFIDDETKGEVKVRFFVVDLFAKIKSKFKKWFSRL
ncbi:MAG TPA: stage II sporulation protein R [Bacilli bacterium]